MPRLREIFRLPWRSRADIAHDVDAELGFHLEMRVSELVKTGLDPETARRRATEEFGDLEFTRRYCRTLDERSARETRTSDRFTGWRHDLGYAVRTLRRSPGFAAVSLLTLALAIGANTAIFSVARAVLLAPLPYGNPDRLVSLQESWPGFPNGATPLSPPNVVDYRNQQKSLVDLAAYRDASPVTWRPDDADPVVIQVGLLEPRLFDVLEAKPLLGRTLAVGDRATIAQDEVVIAESFWRRSFGADSSLVGRGIRLNGKLRTVVGVMPASFTLGFDEELWLPIDLTEDLADAVRTRKQHYLQATGRLKPGVSLAAAEADLQVVARRLEREYPEANTGRTAVIAPLHEYMTGRLRPALLLLQGAALMVLLIACANLANLTLSRTIGRRREFALRAALGAGRARLIRQLITESVLVALIGGLIGVALALVATRTLLALNPDSLPTMFDAAIDGTVLLFSVVISVATGALFGLVPALDAARADLHGVLKDGGRGVGGGRAGERIRRTLVVTQVALAVMLLIGAGLLVRSFAEIARVRLGFDPAHVLTARLTLGSDVYDSLPMRTRFFDEAIGQLSLVPGVSAVGAAMMLPTQGRVNTSIRVEGQPIDENRLPDLGYISVTGGYFAALDIPLEEGRLYDETDRPAGLKTAVINHAAAHRFFPGGSAVGRRFRIGPSPNGEWITVIGVVGDIRDEKVDLETKPTLFANHRQDSWDRSLSLVIRTQGDPATAISRLRAIVRALDPAVVVSRVQPLESVVRTSLAPRRFALGLSSSFAAIALILAAVGIAGVLAYGVSTRTREFGVRLALGASRQGVIGLVLREGLGMATLGVVLGIVGAIVGARILSGMLYGVGPLDPWTYLAVGGGLLLVVTVACVGPAARAMRVDPLESIRSD